MVLKVRQRPQHLHARDGESEADSENEARYPSGCAEFAGSCPSIDSGSALAEAAHQR